MKRAGASLSLLTALAVTACGGTASEAEAVPATRILDYDVGSPEPARVEVDGVAVEVHAPLEIALSWIMTRGEGVTTLIVTQANTELIPAEELADPQENRIWVFGKRLRADGGELRIGSQSYGAVGPESAVRIDADGVHVDGEHRGSAPGPASDPPDTTERTDPAGD